ncbi:hypothetical protein NWO25_01075 [Enterococcus lactis]|nr:hypothetical protein [Enterococcus lactis]
MTLGMLKKQLSEFEASAGVSDDTKIFLDTGWDSIQKSHLMPWKLSKREFTVEDEWTKESFSGYAREEKAERFDASEQSETVIVIKTCIRKEKE